MQLRASLSGAISESGNEGWLRRTNNREVRASIKVSRFGSEVSRVRRISTGEKRLNTSSVDSGSSQNCIVLDLLWCIAVQVHTPFQ